jgi:hypothetical protein
MGSSMSAYRSIYYETQEHLEEVESDSETDSSECCETDCCKQNCEQNYEQNCCEQVKFLKDQIKNLELRIILLERKTKFKSILL